MHYVLSAISCPGFRVDILVHSIKDLALIAIMHAPQSSTKFHIRASRNSYKSASRGTVQQGPKGKGATSTEVAPQDTARTFA